MNLRLWIAEEQKQWLERYSNRQEIEQKQSVESFSNLQERAEAIVRS
jgi:hypothetical protein